VQLTYRLEDMRALTRPQLDEVCLYIEQHPQQPHPEDMVF
jgi:hypothetical protein